VLGVRRVFEIFASLEDGCSWRYNFTPGKKETTSFALKSVTFHRGGSLVMVSSAVASRSTPELLEANKYVFALPPTDVDWARGTRN